jgi:hypothetical protein
MLTGKFDMNHFLCKKWVKWQDEMVTTTGPVTLPWSHALTTVLEGRRPAVRS